MITLGELLRRYRRRANLTQAQLEPLMGYDDSRISRAENGRCWPSAIFIERFITAVPMSPTEQEELWQVYQAGPDDGRQQLAKPLELTAVQQEQWFQLPVNLPIPAPKLAPPPISLHQRYIKYLMSLVAFILFAVAFTHIVQEFELLRTTRGLRVVGTPQLQPTTIKEGQLFVPVGQEITASMQLRNINTKTLYLEQIKIAVRGPHACELGWEADQYDFPAAEITLKPGQTYLYQATWLFNVPGVYFAEPVKHDGQNWGGIAPSPRLYFVVFDPQGDAPSFDCIHATLTSSTLRQSD